MGRPAFSFTGVIEGPGFWVWPDTGQTSCYDMDGNEMVCPSQEEDLFGQDANYQGPQRSYTKLGYVDGRLVQLPDTATPADGWIMTRDNVTGLIWEVKTHLDGVENYGDPHDADNTYTLCPDYGEHHADDFIAALNAQHFGGFSDWRLPTVKELSALVDAGVPYPGPAIDAEFFPNTVPSTYWSSSKEWGVYFASGGTTSMYCVEYPYYAVRAVRGTLVQYDPHFMDNADGTVTDTESGLIWQKCSLGQTYNASTGGCDGVAQEYTREGALAACEGLVTAGYGDWRLPNRNELQSIVDYTKNHPAIDTAVFPGTIWSYYWSSTADAGEADHAWAVDFDNGVIEEGGIPTFRYGEWYGTYVRCVRSGHTGVFDDLSLSVQGEGTVVSGITTTTPATPEEICTNGFCVWPYPHGTEVTLTVTPAPGFTFTGWEGACQTCSTNPVCTVTMNRHKACTALFEGGQNQPPLFESFAVEPSVGEAPLDVAVICQATDPDGTIASYEFDPGDGSDPLTSEDGTFSHTYATAGSYGATCTAVDDEGAQTVSEPVTVNVAAPQNQPPVITSFTAAPTTGTAPLTVAFTCEAHDPDGGDIESIEWYFEGGQWPDGLTTQNDFTASHVYQHAGTYVAHCVVWDDEDQSTASGEITITVAAPVTEYRLDVGVAPADGAGGAVTSGAQAISCPGECSAVYDADAEVTLVAAPTEGHLFAGWGGACAACGTNGSCTVVIDANKTCSADFEPVPNQPPVIDSFSLSPTSGEAPLAVTASCHASDADGSISTYRFDPGDGSGALESASGTFSHTYAAAGSYGATCTAVDDEGAETTSEPVMVSVAAHQPVWQDITGAIEVSRSRTLLDRINRSFFVFLDLTNGSGADLGGPVRMVLRNATLPLKESAPGLDPDGYTEGGDPYFVLVPAGGTWAAGATLEDVRLDFVLQRKRLDFELRFEQLQ